MSLFCFFSHGFSSYGKYPYGTFINFFMFQYALINECPCYFS